MKLLTIAALVSASLGFGAAWQVQSWRHDAAESARVAAEAEARDTAQAEFTARVNAQEVIARETTETLRRARIDAAGAGRAADSLRNHVATLARQCAAPATGSASGASAGDLLADMQFRLEAAGREFAAEADRARAAGRSCEMAYDALRQSSTNR